MGEEFPASFALARIVLESKFTPCSTARGTLRKIFTEKSAAKAGEDAPLLAWPVACGAAVAEKTRALSFVDGVLVVAVPDAVWRNQLQCMMPAVSCGAESNRAGKWCGAFRLWWRRRPSVPLRNHEDSNIMVSEKDVSYVADLAHLELTAEERARMLKDLNSILGYIERLNQLDTDNVEPMAQVASRYSASDATAAAFLCHAAGRVASVAAARRSHEERSADRWHVFQGAESD